MINREKALKKYYRNIKSWLPCNLKSKRIILSRIRGRVAELLAEDPDMDFETIQICLGLPKEIAGAYIDEMGTDELLEQLQAKKKFTKILIIAAAVLIIGVFTFYTIALIDSFIASGGYFTS